MSIRRVHHLQLPSITAATNSLGVRCVAAPHLVPIQVPTLLYRTFLPALMQSETISTSPILLYCRSTRSSVVLLESCAGPC
jgi:hypothetical protein